MRIRASLIFNAVMVALFAYGIYDELAATPRTTSRMIAGAMMIVGFVVMSLVVWAQIRGRIRD